MRLAFLLDHARMGMADSKPTVQSSTLMKALADHGGSNREIAEGAAVSFRSLAEARNGFDAEQLRSSRKQLGVVDSMTRLSTFLRVEPEAVLKELGIDPADPTIRRHLKRVRAESLPPDRFEDSVFQRIRARRLAGGNGHPGPIVGLVRWEPFFDGQLAGTTMGLRIARALLGSLNPDWDRSENLRCCDDFIVAEAQLLADGHATPEVVLGLYDLPWRRGEGVDVVALPGLSVRLGGLSTRELGWDDILLAAEREIPYPPYALVIEGDAGSKLLRGPVVYPANRLLKPLDTFDPVKIAERIKRDVDQYRDKPQGYVFVADGPLVSQVMAELPDVGVAANALHQLRDPKSAPSYRFGIGVPPNADRFRSLLEDAISQDLFGRVLPKTVALYLRLLRDDQYSRLTLDVSEFRRFGDGRDLQFVELALRQAQQADEVKPVMDSLKGAGVSEALLQEANSKAKDPTPTGPDASHTDPGKGRR